MSRSLATVATASAVALLFALAGCSVPAPAPGGDQGEAGDPPAATSDFCTEFEENGGDGSTVGVVLTFASKEDILADVQPRLDAMGDLTPPDEIATEWTTMKEYYGELAAAAEALPDGAAFNTSPEYQALAEAPDEYEAVVDYYFATC